MVTSAATKVVNRVDKIKFLNIILLNKEGTS